MKVYINNYKNHWLSPYTVLEKVLFWKDWENIDYDTPWVEKWSDRLAPICRALQRVLDFFDPKINYVKIDRWDTWSMDHTLAFIILPMLKQLKKDKHGAPFVDDEDVPEELKSTSAPPKVNEYDTDANHFKRWDWAIDEMIFAFECKNDDNADDKFYTGTADYQWKKLDETTFNPITQQTEGLSELVKGPNHTQVVDWDGLKAQQARIQNGFRLFGKYYQGLWD
jgi:hypothetical protein